MFTNPVTAKPLVTARLVAVAFPPSRVLMVPEAAVKFCRVVELVPKYWLKILARDTLGSKKTSAVVEELAPTVTTSVSLSE